ncbi:hypothetical protein PTTG_07893, partial [Puccinia triticina 1-1 BBBD Race 1]
MSNHKSVLQSLNNIPFPTWKGQMKGYLQVQGLKMYIDSTVIAPTDETAALAHTRDMGKTAGYLSLYLGQKYRTQFVKPDNKNNPRAIWLLIEEHFEAKTGDNQAKVVQEFFSINFKRDDVDGFLTDLNDCIQNIEAVGVKIVKAPAEFTLHKTWMSEFLLSKVPASLNIREILLTKRPLTIDILKTLLEGKRRDQAPSSSSSTAPVIKQELALAATT